MYLNTLALWLWALLLLATVVAIFRGVFFPVSKAVASRSGGPLLRADRWCTWFASLRVGVLAVVIIVGLLFGALGAWQATSDASRGAATVPGQDGLVAPYGESFVGRGVDSLYEGMRELTGQVSPRPESSLFSRMARAAWPAMALLLSLEVIVRLFHEPLLRLRLGRCKDHVVVCGLGRIGRELTASCGRSERKVVVVERDRDNPAIADAINDGALVWIGDLTSKRTLRTVRADRAEHVFFASGSDELNLEAANDLLMVLLAPRGKVAPKRNPPKLTVHLDRPELDILLVRMKRDIAQLAERVKAWATTMRKDPSRCDVAHQWLKGKLALRAFNVADRAIQDLFDTHIMDRRPVFADGPEAEVAHFVILGFGPAGQRLALHLAGQAHFENHRRSRMTIVHGPEDTHRVDRFRSEYPALFPTWEIVKEAGQEFTAYHPENLEKAWMPDPRLDDWGFGVRVRDVQNPTDDDRGVRFVCNGGFVCDPAGPMSPAVIERLVALSNDTAVRPMVFICDADDENNCSQGERLREELNLRLKLRDQTPLSREHAITVFPNVPARPMLTQLTTPSAPQTDNLVPFGDASDVCTYGKLSGDPVTLFAQAIHQDYFVQHAPAGEEMPSWEEVRAWERATNLAAAQHINAKLRVLGLRLVPRAAGLATNAPVPDSESLSPELRETIAIMEHNRWMAERLLAGWSLGKRAKPENKRRHQFVPWSMLTDTAERKKDYSQVAKALRVCQRLVEGPDAEFAILRASDRP